MSGRSRCEIMPLDAPHTVNDGVDRVRFIVERW
jgi:hypothetical protein